MAIDSSVVFQTVLGNHRVVVRKHLTPGAGTANNINTGAAYVVAVFATSTGTGEDVVACTPNTSDHSTEALGHYTLECEADVTCYTLEFLSG